MWVWLEDRWTLLWISSLFHSVSYKARHIQYYCRRAKVKGLFWFLAGFSPLPAMCFPSVCSPPLPPPPPAAFCFSFYPQENCLSWPESKRLRPRQVVIVLNAAVYTAPSSRMAWNSCELIAQIEIVWNDKDRMGLKDVLSGPLWLELNLRHWRCWSI